MYNWLSKNDYERVYVMLLLKMFCEIMMMKVNYESGLNGIVLLSFLNQWFFKIIHSDDFKESSW